MKFSTAALMLSGLSMAAAVPLQQREVVNKPRGKWFDRFVVIILENTDKEVAMGNEYFLNLTHYGMLLGGYHGTSHPSQPNYITMVANTIAAGVYDDSDHNSTEQSIVDLFEPAGITWKAYMEGYKPLAGGACNPYSKDQDTLYVRKHNPFMSFNNIRNNTERCKNIVNAEENFAKDVALGAHAPNYMYYVPNLKNDAHDTNVSYAAVDTQRVIDTMLNNAEFMKNTFILLTFDENNIYTNDNFGDPNSIYTLALGNDTLKCYDCVDMNYYNHFTQVVTLERNWNLSQFAGEGWDQWWRPFGQLRGTNEDICGFAPCSEYYDGKTPARADANWNDQGLLKRKN
ncbi:conserved hypothetical protein [Talaromyces stipitatus ATCC 10500]|uniref:Acid phosphatase n=1 Tax=Talaromyces stipitatus (strain ATCC 10500 / CBS 375.48 / QM 6759 / NRRL 1006) TaxID=441959 RepID=B8MHY5_TALSN|nr:uncharacterized protein TSTA_015520 [Talaromyces stipitatus ATCC 10500]EED16465.1 conserved hypothetical protein [Talaromyces stipitatus ATCC 10500]